MCGGVHKMCGDIVSLIRCPMLPCPLGRSHALTPYKSSCPTTSRPTNALHPLESPCCLLLLFSCAVTQRLPALPCVETPTPSNVEIKTPLCPPYTPRSQTPELPSPSGMFDRFLKKMRGFSKTRAFPEPPTLPPINLPINQ